MQPVQCSFGTQLKYDVGVSCGAIMCASTCSAFYARLYCVEAGKRPCDDGPIGVTSDQKEARRLWGTGVQIVRSTYYCANER